MDQDTKTRGEKFKQILIREYEDLLNEAHAEIERHERLLKDYQYTPSHHDELEWENDQVHKDVVHLTKVLAQLKGEPNESPTDGKFACINGM